jgi:hypothetical protein
MTTPKERLLPLISETNRKHIDHYVNFLTKMETPEDISRAMDESGESWGASFNQMFGPLMINLYNQDETIRYAIHTKVGKLGIDNDAIKIYFSHFIVTGPLAVNVLMGDKIPIEKKEIFIELTNQLLLDTLKSYVGIKKH